MAHVFEPKDFTHLLGMEGFSDELLTTHFKLYEGYVQSTNRILEALEEQPIDGKDLEFAELHRRLGFEINGIRLHELYFENLGGDGDQGPAEGAAALIERSFGGFEAWKAEFTAIASLRGIGWAVLYCDPETGRLFNCWISDHEVGHPAGWQPVLVLDVWEHAYLLDYGTEKAEYLEAFFNNVDWGVVAERLEAVSARVAA